MQSEGIPCRTFIEHALPKKTRRGEEFLSKGGVLPPGITVVRRGCLVFGKHDRKHSPGLARQPPAIEENTPKRPLGPERN